VALAFLAAAPPALALPDAGVAVEWVLLPDHAPSAGEALAVRLRVAGPPGTTLELKASLLGQGVEGAQTWNGSLWAPAARYLPPWDLDEAGRAEGWLAVRAKALGEGPWSLQVRVRDARGRIVAEASQDLAEPAGDRVEGLAPGAAAVGAWRDGRLLALAPAHPTASASAPWDLDGRFVLQAPPRAELRGLSAHGADLGPLHPAAPGELRIAEVLVDAAGDEEGEYVRLRNAGPMTIDLTGWSLRIGEAEAVLRDGSLGPGASLALARNASAYATLTGRADAITLRTATGGPLVLPNPGGHLELRHLGRAVDAVLWGGGPAGPGWEGPPLPALPPGRVHHRLAGAPDTDRAADFDPAPWMAAWEGRAPSAVTGEVLPFTREAALTVARHALEKAREEVLVQVYEFTQPPLADALHAALDRGVRVRVLVEGAPVGGVPDAERALLDGLLRAGAEVHLIGGSGRDRYATMHAKFAVIDRAAVLLGSENWTPGGFPARGGGNLGWGAWVRSPALAAELATVWAVDADVRRGDVAAWRPGRGEGGALDLPAPADAPSLPQASRNHLRLLLAPDNARAEMLGLIAEARRTLEVESLQLDLAWSDGPSPVAEALLQAARRGVAVRVLLDGSPGSDNEGVAAALNARAAAEQVPLEARLALHARVHNKGIVVDAERALVSSVNLGEPAMTWNRETALIVEGPAAAFYRRSFEADWDVPAPGMAEAAVEPWWLAGPLAVLVAAGVRRAWRRSG
jgi:phosphatidylserine/phosphatidylglycerophosphate/cardiolipin synthase-like enzyme